MRKSARGSLGLVSVLVAFAASTGYACIPEPDTSGLPARDAGGDTTYVPPVTDGGSDVLVEAASDAPVEASTGPGSIHGAVLNFGEGMGRGVLPGATVSVVGNPSLTAVTGTRGEFVLNNVPSGRVVLDVSHPTDKARGITYGTTRVVVNLAGGQDASVYPFVHTGCFVRFNIAGDLTSGMIRRLQDGCQARTGAYASIYLPDVASVKTSTETYSGNARAELIPVAFPADNDGNPELEWSLGLPDLNGGQLDLLGAMEVRVVIDGDSGTFKDGTPLVVTGAPDAGAEAPTIEVAIQRAPASGETVTAFHFDNASSKWTSDSAIASAPTFGPPNGGAQDFTVASLKVTQFGWFAIGQARAAGASTCVAGRLVAGAAHPGGVLVHGIGADYLGAASATSNADGTFCVDVKASSKVRVVAEYGASSNAFGAISAAKASGNAGPSCASDVTKCTQLGEVPMAAIDASCTLATIVNGDTPLAGVFDVYSAELPNVGPNEHAAGIDNRAYINQVTASATGAVCIPSTPGDSLELQDHTDQQCGGGGAALIQVDPGIPSATCGGTQCFDAGTANYGCP